MPGESPGSATQEPGMAIQGAHREMWCEDRVSCAMTVLLSYALFRAPRRIAVLGHSSFRHWHRSCRLPRFQRACPSTALDERVSLGR